MLLWRCLVVTASPAWACSNLLISGGASVDGSTIISYSADDPNLMGDLSNWPASDHADGALREIYSWDFGTRLGAIPQPQHTYNVVGNTNEHQLTIGETTFGGLSQLNCEQGLGVCNEQYGCIDYGQLIWVTLQRAKTAREAIRTMDELMQTYGYASSGESFSIADPHEVWMLEVIGKGKHAKGTVWVAARIPDGTVAGHANQARIRTFPRNDPDMFSFAKDVVDFPRSIGLYNGTDADFSFSDIFDPVNFEGARFCEARVYSFFEKVAAPEVNIAQYLDYAQGYNLSNRMPVYVKVNKKLSVNDTMWHMRNHYEGTWFDDRKDVGAQAWNSPYRLGEGLTWPYGKATYVNERPIGTQYAAWNFVGNQRPNQKFSVLWFGMDDSTFSLHTPFYGAANRVPAAWSCGNCTGRDACKAALGLPGTIKKFSFKSHHWIQNMIANYAYSRYDQIGPAVKSKLVEEESRLFRAVAAMDEKLKTSPSAAEMATDFSYRVTEKLGDMWQDFYGELFSTYVDGYRTVSDPTNEVTGCSKVSPHFSDAWKQRIVQDTGNHYLAQEKVTCDHPPCPPGLRAARSDVISKLSLKALGGLSKRSSDAGVALVV